MNNIINLPINELYPHPDNPRKDIGDITELTASIKSSGVMQNLTVVKGHYMSLEEYAAMAKAEGVTKEAARLMYNKDDAYTPTGYTVIIGHRRCAAARAAGLTELPCAVVEMSEKEQLSTMMAENMQRVDLTAYEQAKGFQLMFDLGDSVAEISRKTGVSESTVYARKKLLRYKEADFKAAEARQITMREIACLNSITDPERANYLLQYTGTKHFDYEYEKAVKIIKEKEAQTKAAEKVKHLGGIMKTRGAGELDNWLSVGTWYPSYSEKDLKTLLSKIGNSVWGYTVDGYGIAIWRERTADDDKDKEERNARIVWREAIVREADSIFDIMESRVVTFASNYVPKKGDLEILNTAFMEHELLYKNDYIGNYERVADRLGAKPDDGVPRPNRVAITQCYRLKPEETLLKYLVHIRSWRNIIDVSYTTVVDPDICYMDDLSLKHLYKTLEKLGFEVSEEEKNYLYGKHEIYKRKRT